MNSLEKITIPPPIKTKLQKIKTQFANQRILVAFSGGIDSTLITYLASQWATSVKAVTIHAPTTPSSELENAQKFSQIFQIPLQVLILNNLANPDIRNNTPERCYYCKRDILLQLERIAQAENYTLVVDGTNASDLGEIRAGLKALRESHVKSPLAEAGMTKSEIIELTRLLDLPSKDIPSMACLASRIPFDTRLDEELLKKIDQGEQFLRKILQHPSSPLRLRVHTLPPNGKLLARIEASQEIMEKIIGKELQSQILIRLKEIGFTFVTIDLQGFSSGSMQNLL